MATSGRQCVVDSQQMSPAIATLANGRMSHVTGGENVSLTRCEGKLWLYAGLSPVRKYIP